MAAGAGVEHGGVLVVTFEPCAYRVSEAGREEVNGFYVRTERTSNEAPVYRNRKGVILFK